MIQYFIEILYCRVAVIRPLAALILLAGLELTAGAGETVDAGNGQMLLDLGGLSALLTWHCVTTQHVLSCNNCLFIPQPPNPTPTPHPLQLL